MVEGDPAEDRGDPVEHLIEERRAGIEAGAARGGVDLGAGVGSADAVRDGGEDGRSDGAPTLVAVDEVGSLDEAHAAARLLVEHGLGAEVVAVAAPAAPTEAADAAEAEATDPEPVGASEGAGAGPTASGSERADEIPRLETPPGVTASRYQVRVLPEEHRRAAEVLGLVEPEERPPADPEELWAPPPAPPPWKTVLVVWLAAAVLLPVIAGLATYVLLSR